jgi:hypothetical protein
LTDRPSSVGPGRYDALCTYVREQAMADGAVVIVLGGARGDGFSCQASGTLTKQLPALLCDIASRIAAQLEDIV